MGEVITVPGLIDPHVHLREPGSNTSETIASGTMAALIGGYVLIADMPNNPGQPTWTESRIKEKCSIAERDAYIPITFNAGAQPESDNLSELPKMMQFSLALKGYGGRTTGIERKKDYEGPEFEPIIKELHHVAPDKPFLWHPGKDSLPYMINMVANKYGHHLHVCHVNHPDQVRLVTEARKHNLPVSCGVCPHHVLKTSHDRQTEGEFAKMQPPLAKEADAEALMTLLAKGEIQMIETDHAPHSLESKWQAETTGGDCYGVPGIEHAFSLMLYQVKRGNLSMERLIDAMSTQPAKLLGVKIGPKTYSTWALEESRISSEENIVSGAKWTPYLRCIVGGKLIKSVIGGQVVYEEGKIVKLPQKVITSRESEI